MVTLLTRAPSAGALFLLLGLVAMGTSTAVHLVTLPVEWDASFGKALPILKGGNYIKPEDEKAMQRILKAAASTYLAASLAGLLNFRRWFTLWRQGR